MNPSPQDLPRVVALEALLAKMTLAEKAGQMSQLAWKRHDANAWDERVRGASVGSFLNAPTLEERNRVQRLAVEETRLGIPLIFGRDVIHGFRTIFPLPLGQAATFNPDLVERCAAAAAREAREIGVDWTFAPMVDIGRDPRWGRVAESAGEDPYLGAQMGAAMVRGFQGKDLRDPHNIAACAKHFAGYGASEAGKDYSTTNIPEQLLREVHLTPFKACVEQGVLTLMSAFTDLNGIPATANELLLRKILKQEWGFPGFVVSDWGSTQELVMHGLCEDSREAALRSASAGLDLEMATSVFIDHLPALVQEGLLAESVLDEAVRRILWVKHRLGLFERPYVETPKTSSFLAPEHLELAEHCARESLVLLKNEGVLPLSKTLTSVAVIGPLADDAKNQLGCWAYDGDPSGSITPLSALRKQLEPNTKVRYAKGLEDARSSDQSSFAEALSALNDSEVGIVFLGEHWNISGECRSRAFLDLPGAQGALLNALAQTQKPLVLVMLSGRPLTIGSYCANANAVLFAFHPGTMSGPAIADVLLGVHAPCGKLPMTFPRTVGQIPIYYATKHGGRAAAQEFKGIPEGTPLDPVGFDASYLDVEVTPLFPFGYGLSYTTFGYANLTLSVTDVALPGSVEVSCEITNQGAVPAIETVQLYVRDLVGSVTRPVRELKSFQRVRLAPGETQKVNFTLSTEALAFYGNDMQLVTEPGRFRVFVGGDSRATLNAEFTVQRPS